MTIKLANPEGLSVLDRPNSYIGKVVPRPNLERLMQGRGLYVSDVELPRMAHVVFLRSPHAHAKIVRIDVTAAKRMTGVVAVVTGEELAAVITPWVGVLSHLKGLKSAPQHAIAIDRVCWQGEAVAAVVATSRAVAEDAAEVVSVEYEALEAVTDMSTALDPKTPVIHPSLGDNLAFERNLDAGTVDAAFAGSDEVVEADFIFGRHTGVTLEPRAVVADWNAAEVRLTIYQGTQAPHMVQNIAALHLGLEESQVRVVCKDVGGSFRHQGPHLRRRNGNLCAVKAVAAADQVRRRPGRKLQHRHSCPRSSMQGADRRQPQWDDHGIRDRRSHRHRPLFDVSTHQRH
jgi:carbon-monoxide dehydrogenase large subunit